MRASHSETVSFLSVLVSKTPQDIPAGDVNAENGDQGLAPKTS